MRTQKGLLALALLLAAASCKSASTAEQNKALVLNAFDTLFNKRDYVAAKKLWADNYIQHSAHIPPGREGLFDLVRSSPPTMRYENSRIMAEGNFLMLHGRFTCRRTGSWRISCVSRTAD